MLTLVNYVTRLTGNIHEINTVYQNVIQQPLAP